MATLAPSVDERAARASRTRPRDLPAPPQVAMRVLRVCADPKADARLIAAIVEQDPALTAEVLRVVNSAFFGFARRIATVRHAVSILGQRALRNFVLCLAMREALSPDALHGFDTTRFWQASLRRAVAGRVLAAVAGVDAETGFTACLLQDIGLLALVHARPDAAGIVGTLLDLDPDERLACEREAFGITHDRAGLDLARAWDLPEELAWAIGQHHRLSASAPTDEAARLARIAACADWMAAVFDCADTRNAIARTRQLGCGLWQLPDEQVDALLSMVGEQVAEAGFALGIGVCGERSFDTVLREANLALAEENLGYQELAWRLQHTLEEREALSRRLRDEVEKARLVQRALLPDADGQLHFCGSNAPARELSGDFYDFFPSRGDCWCFALGDVSGKGMDAALLMSKASSLFRCLGKAVPDPGRLLSVLNAELCELNTRGMFVTMIAGVLDPSERRVRLANAGHPPALLCTPCGTVTEIRSGAPPLGVLEDAAFPVEEHGLAGRSLYLYSDGVLETAEAVAGAASGVAAMLALIDQVAPLPHRERAARLVNTLIQPDRPLDDDLTVLVLEDRPAARQD